MFSSRLTAIDVIMIAVSVSVFASVVVALWRNWLTDSTGSRRLWTGTLVLSQLLVISGGIASRDLGRVVAGTLLAFSAVILFVSPVRPTREPGT